MVGSGNMKWNVLVALFVDRVGVCDSQETDVERNVFLDDGRFSVVGISQQFSRAVNCTNLTAWKLGTLEYPRTSIRV
jgi:hypothetical protein